MKNPKPLYQLGYKVIDAMSCIIDDPSGREILKKPLINSILYQLGSRFGVDNVKECHDTYWTYHVQDMSECKS